LSTASWLVLGSALQTWCIYKMQNG
jgi:hypothetical protein